MRERVSADDVSEAVAASIKLLSTAAGRDWSVPAGELSWTCWETAEHIADDLFAYAAQLGPANPAHDTYVPIEWQRKYDGAPVATIYAMRDSGVAGLLQVMEACGALLTAMVRVTPPEHRSFHSSGIADPEGFAALGIVEVFAHTHDIAQGLGLQWAPPEHLCDRVLGRLFTGIPAGTPRWPTLLWASGRGDLPGHPRQDEWHVDASPRP